MKELKEKELHFSSLCRILSHATGYDVELYNAKLQLLSYHSNLRQFPENIISYVQNKTHYFDTMLESFSSTEGNCVYLHAIPSLSLLMYDMKIITEDGEPFYVCIGPILREAYSSSLIANILLNTHIPAIERELTINFYKHLPYHDNNTENTIWLFYSTFTECPKLSPMPMVSLNPVAESNYRFNQWPAQASLSHEQIIKTYQDTFACMNAIRRGDEDSALSISSENTDYNLIQRTNINQHRTIKNLLHSANAIYSMAAIDGGANILEIYYKNEVYAAKIEAITNPADTVGLEQEMIKSYCKLVKSYSSLNVSDSTKKILQYVHNHFDQPLTIQSVANALFYSPTYISRKFLKDMHMTMGQYLNQLRIQHAISIFKSTDMSIMDVAVFVGFSSYSKFSVEFKKYTGMSASKYLKKNRNRILSI